MSLLDLTLMEKQVVGSLFGSGNPRADIPKLLGLYREGQLDLDGLVTKTYSLDGVNEGYEDMRAGQEHPRRPGLRMKTRAAVLWGLGQEWKVEEIDLDPPKAGEVLVKMAAAGLCHSDEHLVTGDMVVPDEIRAQWGLPETFPIIGGHEGAGVVVEVGPGVTSVAARRSRLRQLHPVVRPLPVLLDRPPEPVRPRGLRFHARPDHRRHVPPLLR